MAAPLTTVEGTRRSTALLPIAPVERTNTTSAQFAAAGLTQRASHLEQYTEPRVVGVLLPYYPRCSQTPDREVNCKTKKSRSDISDRSAGNSVHLGINLVSHVEHTSYDPYITRVAHILTQCARAAGLSLKH